VSMAEVNFDQPEYQTLTIIGSRQLPAGSYDFLIDCTAHDNVLNSEFKSSKQSLNVVVIG
jgi:hypothetical protein